jgi:hypothetical protein
VAGEGALGASLVGVAKWGSLRVVKVAFPEVDE